ncbi:trafficking protein particle complex II-specific subunit 120, partial [Tanacetum coccineum]
WKAETTIVPNIIVVPSLPLLVSYIVDGDGVVILYEGEIHDLWISVANAACLMDLDNIASKSTSGNAIRPMKDASSPMLMIHYAGPADNHEEVPESVSVMPPGRRLCRSNNSADNGMDPSKHTDRLVKIDPYRGSWGLRFLELELSNPTDVVFEVGVSVQLENGNIEDNTSEFDYPKTRIDRDYTARVLIPLEHFKLPVLDGSFLVTNPQSNGNGGKTVNFSEKNKKAELNASIKNLISKIKVRWVSGRNSSGELHIKDATQAALQTSVMDVLLPDPLTFREYFASKGPVLAHDMTPMEVLVRNNTKDSITMSLSITCRDVAGENCIEGSSNPAVLWSGALSGMKVDVPPLEEIKHSFCLYFLVPGEYTLLAAAVIDDPNEILRARARSSSPDEPVFCRGPPYHVRVNGTL